MIGFPVLTALLLTTLLLHASDGALLSYLFSNRDARRAFQRKLAEYEMREGYREMKRKGLWPLEKKKISVAGAYLSNLKRLYGVVAIVYYLSLASMLLFSSHRPYTPSNPNWYGLENLLFWFIAITGIYSYLVLPAFPFLLISLISKVKKNIGKKDFDNVLKINLSLVTINLGLISVLTATSFFSKIPEVLDLLL
ncbi:MAG: hypothetical protein QW115_05450, partial [Thermoplasmata archaeon]